MARRISVELVGDATKLERTFRQAGNSANTFHRELEKSARGAIAGTGAFRSLGRSLAYASGYFLGGVGIVAGIRSTIEAAGDLNTQMARSTVIFGRSGEAVNEWSKTTYQGMKLARTTALETADSFGQMFAGMGVAPARAAQLSQSLTKVAAAISLARGQEDPGAATKALLVALAGRGRALRQYGIIIDQTSIKEEAARLGLVKSVKDSRKVEEARLRLAVATAHYNSVISKGGQGTPQGATALLSMQRAQDALSKAQAGTTAGLTRQQQAIAAASIAQRQGAKFVGDYGKMMDTAAGRSRAFHQGTKELREELGQQLLPAFNSILDRINKWLASISEGGPKHREFMKQLQGIEKTAKEVASALKGMAKAANTIAQDVGGWGNAFKLVLGGLLASKFLKLATAIRASSTELKALSLTRLAPIAIPVTLAVVGRQIRKGLGIPDAFHEELTPQQAGFAPKPQYAQVTPYQPATLQPPTPMLKPVAVPPAELARLRKAHDRMFATIADSAIKLADKIAQTFTLPFGLQLQQAKAEAFNNQAAIVAAAKAIRANILQQLPKLKGQALLDAYAALGSANSTIASAAQEAADKAKALAQKQKEKLAQARQDLAQAIDNVRQQVGDLFAGPILQPTEAQQKQALGMPGPSGARLTADLQAQVAQYRRLNKDLAILAKRGAPKELLKELRAQGTAALPEIESLAKASKAQLRAYFRAFGSRETLVRRTARMQISHADQVTIHAAHVTLNQRRGNRGSSTSRPGAPAQVRGSTAGRERK